MSEAQLSHAKGPIAPSPFAVPSAFRDAAAYQADVWQRSILFWDTLRQRADTMLDRGAAGIPPVLDFAYETVLDARDFAPAANYSLLRIIRIGDICLEQCADPSKPPVIVVDPRAGHGPGIGGFKQDSEIGMALHAGHAVYFVAFFPDPAPGQTLLSVHKALRRFIEEVSRLHDAAPILYGNCQAGWALTLLAADCHGLTGPVILSGAPLSYWAGDADDAAMRQMGALMGGVWPAHLAADLGHGRFDGAWLVQNFEALHPETAILAKHMNLFAHVDAERDRFLAFERWWNNFVFLSREEIVGIAENLFIGNRLERGVMHLGPDCTVDLHRITAPIVIFASFGDDITPPAQALGWVRAVYPSDAALKAAGQRIVYLTARDVGHLGLFVTGAVARLEHKAILDSLEAIEALTPGLYEMEIGDEALKEDCLAPRRHVTFAPRKIADLGVAAPDPAFDRVRRGSEASEAAYRAFASPVVRAAAGALNDDVLKWLHPMRLRIWPLSKKVSPAMGMLEEAARAIAPTRRPLADDQPFMRLERAAMDACLSGASAMREWRDVMVGASFAAMFGAAARPDPAAPDPAAAS